MAHQVALHAQVFCHRHVAAAADLLEHHMQQQRRTLAQCARALLRPLAAGIGFELLHDRLEAFGAKILLGFGARSGKGLGFGRRGVHLLLQPAAYGIAIGKLLFTQRLPDLGLAAAGQVMVTQANRDAVRAQDVVAGQCQPFAAMARATAQEVATAHVREQADQRLGHGHARAFGQDTVGRTLADAHAATHDDAVHEGDIGLAQEVRQVV